MSIQINGICIETVLDNEASFETFRIKWISQFNLENQIELSSTKRKKCVNVFCCSVKAKTEIKQRLDKYLVIVRKLKKIVEHENDSNANPGACFRNLKEPKKQNWSHRKIWK